MENFSQAVKHDKWMRNLEEDMKAMLPIINDTSVTDIAIGHGGEVIVEGFGHDKVYSGIFYDEAATTRIIYACAAVLGTTVDPANPVVEGVLKKWNIRIEGILPPRSAECPMLFIRRLGGKIFPLEKYLEEKRITEDQYRLLLHHITKRSNILIGGATGSGKTTFLNAIINKMQELTPDDRFFIVEDANEIQCTAKDKVPVFAEGEDTVKAVRISLRCNVDRIIFGELRFGSTTNELLKAWNTGHSGGLSTIHADSALSMISRVRDLLREVIKGELPDIAQSVQLLVHMKPSKNGPLVNEIVETHAVSNSLFMEELEANGMV